MSQRHNCKNKGTEKHDGGKMKENYYVQGKYEEKAMMIMVVYKRAIRRQRRKRIRINRGRIRDRRTKFLSC
jgi:hypothetical protein